MSMVVTDRWKRSGVFDITKEELDADDGGISEEHSKTGEEKKVPPLLPSYIHYYFLLYTLDAWLPYKWSSYVLHFFFFDYIIPFYYFYYVVLLHRSKMTMLLACFPSFRQKCSSITRKVWIDLKNRILISKGKQAIEIMFFCIDLEIILARAALPWTSSSLEIIPIFWQAPNLCFEKEVFLEEPSFFFPIT